MLHPAFRLRCSWLAAICLVTGLAVPALAEDQPVDLELVLAVDVSQSVDAYEGRLQRLGYVAALTDPRVADAIAGGLHGRIAMTYVEWAGPGLWRVSVDWTVVSTPDEMRAFAEELRGQPIARGVGTSITGLIEQAMRMFPDNGFAGERLVIDISGDGPNSSGGLVTTARDAAVAAGIVINGVAINNFDGSMFSLPDLDVYYRECVIGGPASFVIAADGFETFAEAILRKLILEIAASPPADDPFAAPSRDAVPVIRIQGQERLEPQQDGAGKYAPACDVGERMRARDNPNFRPGFEPRGR